jgi:hypothetical protein
MMETALDKRELRVAVRARTNGGYTYQIFTIESEPKTLLSAKKGVQLRVAGGGSTSKI